MTPDAPARRVTIIDVARHADVSTSHIKLSPTLVVHRSTAAPPVDSRGTLVRSTHAEAGG